MTKDELTQAVARGWCHPSNASKVIDIELSKAIVAEVLLELDKAVLSDDVLFKRIWAATKHWDLDNGRPIAGTDIKGYGGMTGDDVRVIMAAIAGESAEEQEVGCADLAK